MGKLNKYMMVHNTPGVECNEVQAQLCSLQFTSSIF